MADQTLKATEEIVGSGHATKSDTANRLTLVEHDTDGTHQKAISHLTASLPIFTDASKKLTSKSAADAMIALVGAFTANYKCFVNAAGNAVEWAVGTSVVLITRDISLTGDQAITTAGFKPSRATFIYGVAASGSKYAGFGVMTAAAQGSINNNYGGTGGTFLADTGAAINVQGSGVASKAVYKSMDTDGCTITWSKTGSPTGTIDIICIFDR